MEPAPVETGLKRLRGKWETEQVNHLLKRTQFGVKKADLQYFQHRGLKKTVRELINTESPLPPPPINNYNDDKYTDPEIQPGTTWISSLHYDGMNNGRRRNSFKSWWLGLDDQPGPEYPGKDGAVLA